MKPTAEHNMLTQQGDGGGLIKVNYNTATCNPCSQYWSTTSKASSQVIHIIFQTVFNWTTDSKHQQIVLKCVITAHVGH